MDERWLRKFHIAPDLGCKQSVVCVIELVRFKAFRNSDPAAYGTDNPSLNGNDNRSGYFAAIAAVNSFASQLFSVNCLPMIDFSMPSETSVRFSALSFRSDISPALRSILQNGSIFRCTAGDTSSVSLL